MGEIINKLKSCEDRFRDEKSTKQGHGIERGLDGAGAAVGRGSGRPVRTSRSQACGQLGPSIPAQHSQVGTDGIRPARWEWMGQGECGRGQARDISRDGVM